MNVRGISFSGGNILVVYDSSLSWVQPVGSRMGVYILWTERETNGSDPEQLHCLYNVDNE